MKEPAYCNTSGSQLGPKNRSGYCRKHFSAATASTAEHGAKISASLKRKIALDPVYRDSLRAAALKLAHNPAYTEIRRRKAIDRRLWEIGSASITPEARARGARAISATKLAWCPPELRPEYLRLIYSAGIRAAEARAMILEQHERDMARFRAKIIEAA